MPKFSVTGALSREIERREALRKTEKRYISLNRRCLRILTDDGFMEYHKGDNPEWEVNDRCTPVAIRNLHGGCFYPDFLVKSGIKSNDKGFLKGGFIFGLSWLSSLSRMGLFMSAPATIVLLSKASRWLGWPFGVGKTSWSPTR